MDCFDGKGVRQQTNSIFPDTTQIFDMEKPYLFNWLPQQFESLNCNSLEYVSNHQGATCISPKELFEQALCSQVKIG